MGELNGTYVPESEVERELLFQLFGVAASARRDGMEVGEIVAAMNYTAATIQMSPQPGPRPDFPEPSEPSTDPRPDCPDCGSEIEKVRPFLGGDVMVEPCDCVVGSQAVSGWIDE